MMSYLQKSIFITFILSLSVTIVNADEIGMNVGISHSPNGEYKLYSDDGPYKIESSGIPYSIFFLLGHAKFSFLNYQSMASTDSSSGCCRASAHIVTQMLSVSYQDVIQNFGDAKIYYSAGIGTLQSVGHYTYNYYSSEYDDYTIDYQGKTSEQFNFGPVLEFGFQNFQGRGFYGLGLTYIMENKVKYEYHTGIKKDESDDVDLGGHIISLISGIYF